MTAKCEDGDGSRQALPRWLREDRPDAGVPARRGGPPDQGDRRAPSSTRRSSSTSASGSTSATPRSSCAAPSALPTGLGKDVSIAVFAEGDAARRGRATPAPTSSAPDDLAERVEGGWTDFDVAIAHASQMPNGRQARAHPRPAGQDAQPQGRHRHRWTSPRPSRRPRPARSSTGPTARRSSTWRSARPASRRGRPARELRRGDRGDQSRQARGGEGATSSRSPLTTTMGPGIRVDPAPDPPRRDHAGRGRRCDRRRGWDCSGIRADHRRARGGGRDRLAFCAHESPPQTAGGTRCEVRKSSAGERQSPGHQTASPGPPARGSFFGPASGWAPQERNGQRPEDGSRELAREELKDAQAIFAVDYRGISVPQAAELRSGLRDADARFRVVKNRLTLRAADEAGTEVPQGAPGGADSAHLRQRRRRAGCETLFRLGSEWGCSPTRAA